MKVIKFEPKNYYTCQGCHREFISSGVGTIVPGFLPVCSRRCEFKVIYKFFSNMDIPDKNLEFIQKTIEKKENIGEFRRHTAVFVLTKHYMKKGLSSINIVRQLDKDKKLLTNNLTIRQVDKTNPPYVIGGLSTVLSNNLSSQGSLGLSNLSKESNSNVVENKQKDLKLWF